MEAAFLVVEAFFVSHRVQIYNSDNEMYKKKAETQLVEALKAGRERRAATGTVLPGGKMESKKDVGFGSQTEGKAAPPPPPNLSAKEEEIAMVKTLEATPKFDGNRAFPGLAKQKIQKKERHMKAIDEFGGFVDGIAGDIEQDVLRLSRALKDDLEKMDLNLAGSYKQLKDSVFVIPKSEDDLKDMLKDLKMTVAARLNIIDAFGEDLDELEAKRAHVVGRRLKELVDKLVSIAHQLPDEIEHIAESQIFDLNTVLTANRQSHSTLLGILRKTQVEVEIETIQRWEDGRVYWRQLRHDKGLADFTEDILSERFTAPADRVVFLEQVKEGQSDRQERRLRQLQALQSLDAANITSKAVVAFQEECGVIAEDEMGAIQSCYEGLGELRRGLSELAGSRVEELRKELHVYGALHSEPPMREIATVMREALENAELGELWRLGGGLKPDFTSMSRDLCSIDLCYDDFVSSIQHRLELIVCGFNLREILEERGRLMQLDKLRTLSTKLRTVPKGEVPEVLHAIMPELGEILEYDKLTDKFISTLKGIQEEMVAEIERVDAYKVGLEAQAPGNSMSATSLGDSQTTTKRGGGSAASTSRSSKSGKHTPTVDLNMYIDQNLVKAWNRRLGIVFYGCDLPVPTQETCTIGLQYCSEQLECNRLVDEAVLNQSNRELDLMNKRYKRLTDDIANFLEAQANYIAVCLTNIGSFYLVLAKAMEAHRVQQNNLDVKSEDQLFNLKEDFRVEKEDREEVYEQACQKMRESVSLEELQDNFEAVLGVLGDIQDAYRIYHGDACFGADKYPLSLADEFNAFTSQIGSFFGMQPRENHDIVVTYNSIFDETIRLNKRYFKDDLHAGGVPPRPKDVAQHEQAMAAKRKQEEAEARKATGEEEGENGGAESIVEGNSGDAETEGVDAISAVDGGSQGTGDASEAVEEYLSPLAQENAKKKRPENRTPCLSGPFIVLKTLADLVQELTVEKDEDDPATAPSDEEPTEHLQKKAAPIPHPECVFVRKIIERLPLDKAGEELLDEYDLNDYEKGLAKAFIELDEDGRALLTGDGLNSEDLYEYCAQRVKVIRERLAREEDPAVLRTNVPYLLLPPTEEELALIAKKKAPTPERDGEGEDSIAAGEEMEEVGTRVPWVLQLNIETSLMQELVGSIRDSFVSSVEREAKVRLKAAEVVKTENKQDFTDELEDRLRTHWPRRGRVETGIKQPREAELLGHAEKTYRHIDTIHAKMIDIQRRFVLESGKTKAKCDAYVNEVKGICDHVTGTSFRNLAVLQGIEVKARSLFLDFQTDNAKQLQALKRIVNDEVNACVHFAVDFKKVCPKQQPGVEGGYSEAELEEIDKLVNGQCEEAHSVQEEWNGEIDALASAQEESLKAHGEFSALYEQTVQSVAMSEGLGQKYGAPRRRAQERIRTEVQRDEQAAGKIDEMLANLEFICDEVKRTSDDPESESLAGSVAPQQEELVDNGYAQIQKLNEAWALLCRLRTAAKARVDYLQVEELAMEIPDLEWLQERIKKVDLTLEGAPEEPNDEEVTEPEEGMVRKVTELAAVMDEVDQACRAETRELYEAEGKGAMLGEGGVPESLQAWLEESKEKILGNGGHREKAWKRLWAQVERFEMVMGRVLEELEEDTQPKNLSAPSAAIRLITDATTRNLSYVCEVEEKKFAEVIKTFGQAREKHERLLRPRLGSPDAADELQELDDMEQARSGEFSTAVLNFRAELVRELVDQACKFCEDISLSSTTLVKYLDSSLRLEAMQLPPGTAVPKKRMTLKRMRKAQRLKSAIEAGEADRRGARDWPALTLEQFVTVVESAQDLVAGAAPPPKDAPTEEEPPAKGKKGGKKGKEPEPEPEADGPPPLLPKEWIDATVTNSVVHGNVSTAHRTLIKERDAALQTFAASLNGHLREVRERYASLLGAENSWLSRWKNQVGMLRSGDL